MPSVDCSYSSNLSRKSMQSPHMMQYLPNIFQGRNMIVDKYDLQSHDADSGLRLHTYTVCFHEEEMDSSVAAQDSRAPEQKFSFINGDSNTKKERKWREQNEVCSRCAPSNAPKPAQFCRCDGPCGKMKPVSEMRLMGLCDHSICKECAENAPAVGRGGEIGCPNPQCYLTDLACLCTDRRRRHKKFQKILKLYQRHQDAQESTPRAELTQEMIQKPDSNVDSSIVCVQMVYVRVTAFLPESGGNRVRKQQKIIEVASNETLQQVIEEIPLSPRIKKVGLDCIFFVRGGRTNIRSSWKRFRPEDLNEEIANFADAEGRVDIIFDCVNS